jgi:hypothetical protein
MQEIRRQVAERLATASAEEIQRLAEAYARVAYPARFAELIVAGRNIDSQTISGWPDAWALRDGRLDAVEATRDFAWEAHLRDDYEKAKASPLPLDGIVFLAANPKARCKPTQIERWKREFARLGLPAENVNILVGLTAIELLAEPALARARHDILRISPLAHKFSTIGWSDELEGLGTFVPTRQEYLEGLVHRPALADEVEQELVQRGWSLVLGRGASGKTVLAHAMACSRRYRERATYFYDLAKDETYDPSLSNQLASDLLTFGVPGGLFVVDNIHVNERCAQDFFDAWISMEQRPDLLLLAREVKRWKSNPSARKAFKPLTLIASRAEVIGVFRRIAARFLTNRDGVIPEPPADSIEEWVRIFGGNPGNPSVSVDLFSLSAAMQRRMPELLRGNWALAEFDARELVREEYLQPVSTGERRNLIRLALLPDDARMSEGALADRIEGFTASAKRGLVFEEPKGRDGRLFFRFVHAALGRLITEASGSSSNRLSEYLEISKLDIDAAYGLAADLLRERRVSEATTVVSSVLGQPDWIERFAGSLLKFSDAIGIALSLGIASAGKLDAVLDTSALSGVLSAGSIESQVAFLEFAETQGLRRTCGRAAHWMAWHAEVIAAGLGTCTLDVVANSLKRLSGDNCEYVNASLLKAIRANSRGLLDSLRITPLEKCAYCIEQFDAEGLGDLLLEFAANLMDESDLLVERALSARFHQLSPFLAALGRPAFRVLRAHLMDSLMQPQNVEKLVQRAYAEPLNSLPAILDIEPFGSTIAAAIDLQLWNEHRRQPYADTPSYYTALSRRFFGFGRSELMRVLAQNQIQGIKSPAWNTDHIHLPTLTHIVRQSELPQEETAEFIRRVVSEQWLKRQYTSAQAKGIVGALFSIISTCSEATYRTFHHAALNERVARELDRCGAAEAAGWLDALGLLGVYSTMGGDCQTFRADWPTDEVVAQLVSSVDAEQPDGRVSIAEFQLWLGLRQMAKLRPQPIRIDPNVGGRVLARLRGNLPYASPNGVTRRTLPWMEQCEAAGWLVVASDPVPDLPDSAP